MCSYEAPVEMLLLAVVRMNLAIAGAVAVVLLLRPPILRRWGEAAAVVLWAAPLFAAAACFIKPRQRVPTPVMDRVLALAHGRTSFDLESWVVAHAQVLTALWVAGAFVALGVFIWPLRRALLGAGWASGATPESAGLIGAGSGGLVARRERLALDFAASRAALGLRAARALFWFNPLAHLACAVAAKDLDAGLLSGRPCRPAPALGTGAAAAAALATGWAVWALQPARASGEVPRVVAAETRAAAAAAPEQPGLRITRAAMRVTVIPEDRSDIAVTVLRPASGGLPQPRIRRRGRQLVVDGGLSGRPWAPARYSGLACEGPGSVLHLDGAGVADDALPVLEARVPRDVRIIADGAVSGTIGAAVSTALHLTGCGDWTVGPASRRAALALDGSGRIDAADPGEALLVAASGSASIAAQGVGVRTADLENTGAGRVTWNGVATRLNVALWGSGDVEGGRFLVGVLASVPGAGTVCYARRDATRNCIRGEGAP